MKIDIDTSKYFEKFQISKNLINSDFNIKLTQANLLSYKYYIYYILHYLYTNKFSTKLEINNINYRITYNNIHITYNNNNHYIVPLYVFPKPYLEHKFKQFASKILADLVENSKGSALNNDYLLKTLGVKNTTLQKIIKFLTDNEIIILLKNYSTESKTSRIYKLNDLYLLNTTKVDNLDILLKNRLKQNYKQRIEEMMEHYIQLYNMCYNIYKFDEKKAFKILKKLPAEDFETNVEQIEQCIQSNTFHTGQKVNRLYTKYTTLKSEFRTAIKHPSGEELFEIDITNCQPFLLNKFIDDTKDGKLWKKLTSEGKLYEYFVNDEMNRTEVKTEMFKFMFGDLKHNSSKLIEIIKIEFPSVFEAALQLNKLSKSGHRASIFQNLEAEITLDSVAKRCIALNIDILTIHDSIICCKQHKDVVAGIISEEVLKNIGCKPSLKIRKL